MPIVGTIGLSGCNFQIAYDVISQSTTNNTSTISIYGILNVTNSYVAWSSGTAWTHNTRAGLATRYNQGSYVLTQDNYTFSHDVNGNCTITVGYGLSSTYTSGSSTATWTLPKINRVAVTNNIEGNDVEGNFKVNYTKYVDSYTYKLRISIPNVVRLDTIDYNTSGEQFTLSQTALNTLLGTNPNTGQLYMTSSSINLGFAVETWNGSTQLSTGNEVIVQCFLNNANPVFTAFDVEEDNNTIKTLTGSTKNNVINIKGYSNIKATVTTSNKAQALKQATMSKYRFSIDGNTPIDITYSDNENVSGTIQGALSGIYNLYAIDNRNNSTLVTRQAIEIKDYSKIALNKQSCSLVRDDNQVGENAILTLDGNYWNESFGVTTNDVTSITYRFKKSDSSTWINGTTTITPTKSGNSFTFSGAIASDNSSGKWDLDSSYNVEVTVGDYLSSDTISFILNSAVPTLSLDKNGVGVLCSYDNDVGGGLQVLGEKIYNKLEVDTLFNRLQFIHGTITPTVSGDSYRLFTLTELRNQFNVPNASTHNFVGIVNNGDGQANSRHMESCTWSSNGLYAVWNGSVSNTTTRFNYIVFYLP